MLILKLTIQLIKLLFLSKAKSPDSQSVVDLRKAAWTCRSAVSGTSLQSRSSGYSSETSSHQTDTADESVSSLIFSRIEYDHNDESMNQSYEEVKQVALVVRTVQREEETPKVGAYQHDQEKKIPRVKESRGEIGKKKNKMFVNLFRRLSIRKNLKNFSPFSN